MSVRRDESELQRWLRFAREDLLSAKKLQADGGIAPREVCALSQQAAEKALKAVLIMEGRRVPRTHDLRELRAVQAHPAAEAVTDAELDSLTDWMRKGRYPGDWDEPLAADARVALGTAEAVVAAVEARSLAEAEGSE